jgi:hypothetical protein
MVDLPHYSVLISGLDHWTRGDEVIEPRLTAKLEQVLDLGGLRLFAPPVADKDPRVTPTGIRAWQFPEWFITQDVGEVRGTMRSRRLVNRKLLEGGKFRDDDKKRHSVVPIRFVRACRKGHIGDIDWYLYVHRGDKECRRPLWIDERGTSGDLAEVWVRCECKDERPLSDAASLSSKALGYCDGLRPWLGPYSRESCGEPSRLLVRHASNAYFSQLIRVISLPEQDDTLVKAVDRVWEHYLQYVETIDQLSDERHRKPPVAAALEGFDDEEILTEIKTRKTTGSAALMKPVKQAELEVLLASKDEIGTDRPDGDFFARSLTRERWESHRLARYIDRVVLVHRLREVTALVGFTRFEAAAADAEGELELGVQRAALAHETTWLPAVENRGEGVFLFLDPDTTRRWQLKPEVRDRARNLMAGFDQWKADHKASKREFPGPAFVMLHSLSHLLLTAMAIESGYPASSISERIYAGPPGYGILLYTGSPDAEGTLGGLVDAGRNIARHLEEALELAILCSNDPVCSQHDPRDPNESRFLLGAACHGCLLISETSCEQHNDFLDRALVVPTISHSDAAFLPVG